MLKVIENYKGGIIFILVLIVMLNMYTSRIKELNLEIEKTSIAYYEK